MVYDRHSVIAISKMESIKYLVHWEIGGCSEITPSIYKQLKKEISMAKVKMTGQKVTRTSSSGRSSQKENSSKDIRGSKKK